MSRKVFYMTFATASLIAAVCMSDRVKALPNSPSYFCYEQTSSGQTVNLNNFCAQNPPLPPKPTPQPSPKDSAVPTQNQATKPSKQNQATKPSKQSTAPQKSSPAQARVTVNSEVAKVLSFSDLSYRNGVLQGKAKNITKNTLTENALLFEMRVSSDNVNWKTIDGAIACLDDPELPAKATTSFNGEGEANAKRVIISKLGTHPRCE